MDLVPAERPHEFEACVQSVDPRVIDVAVPHRAARRLVIIAAQYRLQLPGEPLTHGDEPETEPGEQPFEDGCAVGIGKSRLYGYGADGLYSIHDETAFVLAAALPELREVDACAGSPMHMRHGERPHAITYGRAQSLCPLRLARNGHVDELHTLALPTQPGLCD